MAPTFRYRYVDIGTVFTGDTRSRDGHDDAGSPSTLFSNELACDVGGTCWGANEPLAVLDHPLAHPAPFPSASAAVLHKSRLIRDRFSKLEGVVWLVTHKEPDFDAFCSMYLARWLIADDAAGIDWQRYGLHPDGWLDLPDGRKTDWLNPDLRDVLPEHRWALLLAGYASMLDLRRPIPCPRKRALHSVLYAALQRGRDYRSATSGATEFFDEVRSNLITRQLNPAFDSVLEASEKFAPELILLDREAEAYERDLRRARKALAYLPESEAPTPDFFQHAGKPVSSEVNPESLLLADSFRIATDGIYLRDPECVLFAEWARVDVENSSLKAGFEFTAIAYSNGRPQAPLNSTRYTFCIDPERARGRHLHTVWSRLQTEEVEALRRRQEQTAPQSVHAGFGGSPEQPSGTLQALLADPWAGGQSQSSTTVDTPQHGTLIGPPGARGDLGDDVVAQSVETELEAPLYTPASLLAGPQFAISDFAALQDDDDAAPRQFDFNQPLSIPPPAEGHFRFASIGLRSDVPISDGGILARQVAERLWHALCPNPPGALPQDFEQHVVVNAGHIGVWSDRGIAVAHKQRAGEPGLGPAAEAELQDFAAVVSFVREIDELAAGMKQIEAQTATPHARSGRTPRHAAQQTAATSGNLARRALELQAMLGLPERNLLRQFCHAIQFDRLVARLGELNHSLAEQAHRAGTTDAQKRGDEVSRLRRRLRWLQAFVVGFIALEIVEVILRGVELDADEQQTLALFGGPLILGFAAMLLRPWRTRRSEGADRMDWILAAAIVIWTAMWLAQLLRVW